jgi:carbamoyl-phosphate synthase large subunit
MDAIERGEDRMAFKETMDRLGIEMPKARPVTRGRCRKMAERTWAIRWSSGPAYTMGGTGGGLVYNVEELRTIAARGLAPAW